MGQNIPQRLFHMAQLKLALLLAFALLSAGTHAASIDQGPNSSPDLPSLVDSGAFDGELQGLVNLLRYGDHDGISWEKIYSLAAPAYFQSFLKEHDPVTVLGLFDSLDISEDCKGHTTEWLVRLVSPTTSWKDSTWALHMIDSWGKIPEGILHGHVNSMGDFDECVGLRASGVNFSDPFGEGQVYSRSFSGRYCSIALTPKPSTKDAAQSRSAVDPEEFLDILLLEGNEGIKMYPSIGTCFPSSCSGKDIVAILNATAVQTGVPVVFTNLGCYTDQKPAYDTATWAMICVLAVFVALNLGGTMLELIRNNSSEGQEARKPGIGVQALLAFSLITNIRKWQNTQQGGAENFGCLHGLRFFSMMWVVLAHTWLMLSYTPFWNMIDVKKGHEEWSMMAVLNGTLSVDTFFVMGGFLVAYNLLKIYDKTKGKLNLFMFYLHRYLRLTPTYAILVGIMATILPYVSNGPYWAVMDTWGQWCRDNWWTNLLYINNLYHASELCQAEAWYLSVDMQLYIFTPFLVLPLWKWRTKGLILLSVITVLSIIAPGLQVYLQDTVPTVLPTRANGTFYKDIYIKPWARAQTYVVGIWLGYIMFRLRGKKVKLSKLQVAGGWLACTAIAAAILFGIPSWFDPLNEVPVVPGVIYASFHRFGWGLSICWIIFACVYGYGGYVDRFLSWSPLIPLGRLTFCTYLVSLHLQMIYHLTFRQPAYYSRYSMTAYFFNHAVLSLIAGFVCTLLFESPFLQLEKILLPGASGSGKSSTPKQTATVERNGIYYNTMEDILKSYKPPNDDNNNADTKEV